MSLWCGRVFEVLAVVLLVTLLIQTVVSLLRLSSEVVVIVLVTLV